MALPVPNLDDRRFQDLVDDAKRLVQQRCPEWTDHNVSDPGVTLIELFAWMTDQLLYRLNRVPDRHYVKFLELIGVRLFPPTAARTRRHVLAVRAAARRRDDRRRARRSRPSARTRPRRSSSRRPTDLPIVPCSLARARLDDRREDATATTARRSRRAPTSSASTRCRRPATRCSSACPRRCRRTPSGCGSTPTSRASASIPTNPPLAWEAWTGDGLGGLRARPRHDRRPQPRRRRRPPRPARATSPRSSPSSGPAGCAARVAEPTEGQPAYSASPSIDRARAAITIGGTVDAVNAELVRGEEIGVVRGRARPAVRAQARPRRAGRRRAWSLEVADDEGWEEWAQVADFAASGPDDRHFVLDVVRRRDPPRAGRARSPTATLRRYGGVPPKGAQLRVRRVPRRAAAGAATWRPARSASSRSSIPFVEPRREPPAGARRRRRRGHRERQGPRADPAAHPRAAPSRPRTTSSSPARRPPRSRGSGPSRRATAPTRGPCGSSSSRRPSSEQGRLRFDQLVPAEETLQKVADRLDECRVIGTRVDVEPPVYRGITIVARLRARPRVEPDPAPGGRARRRSTSTSTRSPAAPTATGWPFGRPVHVGEVYSVLQGLRGTELVEDVRLFGADPITGQRGQQTQRLELEPHALVFSYEHQVLVEGA